MCFTIGGIHYQNVVPGNTVNDDEMLKTILQAYMGNGRVGDMRQGICIAPDTFGAESGFFKCLYESECIGSSRICTGYLPYPGNGYTGAVVP